MCVFRCVLVVTMVRLFVVRVFGLFDCVLGYLLVFW